MNLNAHFSWLACERQVREESPCSRS